MPLYVEDFANAFGKLRPINARKAGRGRRCPLTWRTLRSYGDERSSNDAPLRGGLCDRFGSLFRVTPRTTYRAPLRGGLCHTK